MLEPLLPQPSISIQVLGMDIASTGQNSMPLVLLQESPINWAKMIRNENVFCLA
jgi:hypothetical protein